MTTNADAVGLTYRALTTHERDQMYAIKEKGKEFLDLIDELGTSDELSTSKVRIEEAVMWAVKHLTSMR